VLIYPLSGLMPQLYSFLVKNISFLATLAKHLKIARLRKDGNFECGNIETWENRNSDMGD